MSSSRVARLLVNRKTRLRFNGSAKTQCVALARRRRWCFFFSGREEGAVTNLQEALMEVATTRVRRGNVAIKIAIASNLNQMSLLHVVKS